MVNPDLPRKHVQNARRANQWVLLWAVGTVVTTFLALLVPNGFLIAYPAKSLIMYIEFWLHDMYPSVVSLYPTPLKITAGYFAGTDTYVEEVLAIAITSVYFGIIFALISFKKRRQIYAAIGLIVVYLLGICRVLLSAIAMMS